MKKLLPLIIALALFSCTESQPRVELAGPHCFSDAVPQGYTQELWWPDFLRHVRHEHPGWCVMHITPTQKSIQYEVRDPSGSVHLELKMPLPQTKMVVR